jgi:multiple sugar transport system substrate-binding protein
MKTHNTMSLVLICMLLVGVLFTSTNCPSASQRLTVMYLKIWADSLNKALEGTCKEWGRNNGVEVNMVQVSLKDLDAKTASLVEAGRGADLAVFPAHQVAIYRDKLADMDDLARELETTHGQFYDVAKSMTFLDGHWKGIPLYAWSHVIVYRKDLLEAKGLSPAASFQELAYVAKELTDEDSGLWGLGIGLGKDDDIAMFFQSLLWAYGGRVFQPDGKTVAINSPETRSALTYLVDLYRAGAIPPGAPGWDGASNNKNFMTGKIAITANAPTIYYVAKHEKPEMAQKILHTVYPEGPAGRFSYATGFTIVMLKGNRNADLAKNLLRCIFEKENYSALITAGEGSVDPWIHGFEDLEIWQDPELVPGLQSLDIMKHVGWPGPVTRAAAEVYQRRILPMMLSRVINDKLSVDAAVAEAEVEIRRIAAGHQE